MEHPAAFPLPEEHTPAAIPLWVPTARGNKCTPSNYSYETVQSSNCKISSKCVFCLSLLLFCFHRKEVIINKLLHKSTRAVAGSFKAIDKNQSIHCKRPTFTISLIRMQRTNSMAPDGKIPSGRVPFPETMACHAELFSSSIPLLPCLYFSFFF